MKFAKDDAAFNYLLQKFFILRRINNVYSATKHGYGTPRFQRAAVGKAVNAASRPAYDRQARRRQVSAQFQGDVFTVSRIVARTDYSDTLSLRLQSSAIVEKYGRGVNLLEQRRIIFVKDTAQADSLPVAIADKFIGGVGVIVTKGYERLQRIATDARLHELGNVSFPSNLGTAEVLHEQRDTPVAETFRAAHRRQIIFFQTCRPPAPYNTTKNFYCKFFALK